MNVPSTCVELQSARILYNTITQSAVLSVKRVCMDHGLGCIYYMYGERGAQIHNH